MKNLQAGTELLGQNETPASRWASSGLLGTIFALLRTVKFARRTRTLRIRETLALGERRQLLVVEWGSKSYLLGATAQGISVLDHDAQNEIAEGRTND